jgi:AraC-like DNA-binding protein
MLIPQGARHMVGQDAGERSHIFAIHFYANIVGGINLLDLLGFPAYFPGLPDAPYQMASHRLAREFAVAAPGWVTAMATDILRVLFYLIRRHGSSMRLPQGTTGRPELLRLLPALEMIEQMISDHELSVGDLAAQVCLSESQFRKLFRRVTGMGPVQFIQSQRIKRACALLRTSDLSVGRITELCGFNDQSFFVRIFKAHTNTSPSHYRKVREL